MQQNQVELRPGSRLQEGKYEILRVLGQGGFGITYLAEQLLVDRKVCIKEFFVRDLCDREGTTSRITQGTSSNAERMRQYMEKFIKEAKTIARLNHPNIVHIHDVFRENNTAYIVMEYIDGVSLGEIVESRGALPEKEAVAYIKKVGEALSFAHSQHVMHLDVKPSNIMIDRGHDRPVLIDFGLSKQYADDGSQTSSTPVGISHGYAPIEQYQSGGVKEFSPVTDIYSLGATLYKLLTGMTPPTANAVLESGVPDLPQEVSADVRNAISAAMQTRRRDRPQSVEEFIRMLGYKETVEPAKQKEDAEETFLATSSRRPASKKPEPAILSQSRKPGRNGSANSHKIWPWFVIGIIAVILAVLFIVPRLSSRDAYPVGPVDMGLSVQWGSCNIGANKPEEYGEYYTYGGTRTKPAYSRDNYLPYDGNMLDEMTEDGKTLAIENDIANVVLGGKWRIPTAEEWDELIKCCDSRVVSVNGVKGIEMKSRITGQRIILPAAGYREGTDLMDNGEKGFFWTSSRSVGKKSMMGFYDKKSCALFACDPHKGLSVRPVYGEQGLAAEQIEEGVNPQGGSKKNLLDRKPESHKKEESQSASSGHKQKPEAKTEHISSTSELMSPPTEKQPEPRGDVTVNTTPTGAQIWMDGVNTGRATPCTLESLPVGEHRLILKMGGYSDKIVTVMVKEGEKLTVDSSFPNTADLGLSVLWAAYNVGASRPEQYGRYYAWGETVEKTNYNWSSYSLCTGGFDKLTKYCNNWSYGQVDSKYTLEKTDDAACSSMKNGWRTPTDTEWAELINNCTFKWMKISGTSGFLVTSNINGNSIFLPAAGNKSNNAASNVGVGGYYWTASVNPKNPSGATYAMFDYTGIELKQVQRGNGLTIRAVKNK